MKVSLQSSLEIISYYVLRVLFFMGPLNNVGYIVNFSKLSFLNKMIISLHGSSTLFITVTYRLVILKTV